MARWWLRLVAAGAWTTLGLTGAVGAEPVRVSLGLSSWAGVAPLVLAKAAGIYAKHGLDVSIQTLSQSEREAALLAGRVDCAATSAESWLIWNAAGTDAKQIFAIDKSFGSDGIAVRPGIATLRELRGKTVAVSGPGTASYFFLAWSLAKAGLTLRDVILLDLEAGPAANALVAGKADAAVTYEPYLAALREKPDVGTVLTTTLDEPVISDTFGCRSAFLASQPQAAKALADSFFEVLELIAADPVTSYARMGAPAKQTGTQFSDVAQTLRWQDRYGNILYFGTDYPAFAKDAGTLLLQLGLIRRAPDALSLIDTRFIQ